MEHLKVVQETGIAAQDGKLDHLVDFTKQHEKHLKDVDEKVNRISITIANTTTIVGLLAFLFV